MAHCSTAAGHVGESLGTIKGGWVRQKWVLTRVIYGIMAPSFSVKLCENFDSKRCKHATSAASWYRALLGSSLWKLEGLRAEWHMELSAAGTN